VVSRRRAYQFVAKAIRYLPLIKDRGFSELVAEKPAQNLLVATSPSIAPDHPASRVEFNAFCNYVSPPSQQVTCRAARVPTEHPRRFRCCGQRDIVLCVSRFQPRP
jgi:hypothetical protein